MAIPQFPAFPRLQLGQHTTALLNANLRVEVSPKFILGQIGNIKSLIKGYRKSADLQFFLSFDEIVESFKPGEKWLELAQW